MPATLSRRPGTTYFTTCADHEEGGGDREDRPGGRPPPATAHTRMATRIRTAPGRIGTRMPTRPTAITRPTSDFGEASRGRPCHTSGAEIDGGPGHDDGPGPSGPGPSRGLGQIARSVGRDGRACRRACGSRRRRSRRSPRACLRARGRGGRRRAAHHRTGAPREGRPGHRNGRSGPRRSARRCWGQLQWSHRPHFSSARCLAQRSGGLQDSRRPVWCLTRHPIMLCLYPRSAGFHASERHLTWGEADDLV